MAKQMGAWAIVFAVVLFSQSVWADAFVVKAGEPLTITGPDGWRLVRKPNALGFGYAKGTMLLVR